MKKVFIASHAHFASGIMSTVQFLLGNCDNVTIFDAYLDENSVESKLDEFFKDDDGRNQIILISDVYGGSVNTIMYQYSERPNTILITGVNIAFMLELLSDQEEIGADRLDELIQDSRMAMRRVTWDETSKEEEFF